MRNPIVLHKQETDLSKLRSALETIHPYDHVERLKHGFRLLGDIHSEMNDIPNPTPELIRRATALEPQARKATWEMRRLATYNAPLHAFIVSLTSDFHTVLNGLPNAQRKRVLDYMDKMSKRNK
ncbi:MAG: hypothetical protein AABX01_03035 [Candidatus Micrarchaeota archaeon]|mgnify:CR=1 FL=1